MIIETQTDLMRQEIVIYGAIISLDQLFEEQREDADDGDEGGT